MSTNRIYVMALVVAVEAPTANEAFEKFNTFPAGPGGQDTVLYCSNPFRVEERMVDDPDYHVEIQYGGRWLEAASAADDDPENIPSEEV